MENVALHHLGTCHACFWIEGLFRKRDLTLGNGIVMEVAHDLWFSWFKCVCKTGECVWRAYYGRASSLRTCCELTWTIHLLCIFKFIHTFNFKSNSIIDNMIIITLRKSYFFIKIKAFTNFKFFFKEKTFSESTLIQMC